MEGRETPRIEAWYRDPTWTDGLRMSLTIGELDRIDRQQRELTAHMEAAVEKIEAMVSRKLDRLTVGVGGLMATGLGILLALLLQRT